jgi:putative effector of murein hydrolase
MTKQMVALVDSILSSTVRTARAAVLIVVLALVPGVAPALDVVMPNRPATPAVGLNAGQQARGEPAVSVTDLAVTLTAITRSLARRWFDVGFRTTQANNAGGSSSGDQPM